MKARLRTGARGPAQGLVEYTTMHRALQAWDIEAIQTPLMSTSNAEMIS